MGDIVVCIPVGSRNAAGLEQHRRLDGVLRGQFPVLKEDGIGQAIHRLTGRELSVGSVDVLKPNTKAALGAPHGFEAVRRGDVLEFLDVDDGLFAKEGVARRIDDAEADVALTGMDDALGYERLVSDLHPIFRIGVIG